MRPIRIVAATAFGAGLAVAPTIAAQDVVPAGWGASTAVVEGPRLHGAMQRDGTWWDWSQLRERPFTVTVGFVVSRPPDLPAPCTVPAIPAPAPAATRVAFDVTPVFECNGTYPVAITGSADGDGGTATLRRAFVVAMPAPAVTGVAVQLDGDAVDVRWDDMTAQAKDLTGYRVTRQVDGGEPTLVAEVGRAPDGSLATTARDGALPERGVLTYEVVALRSGTGAGPSGQGSRAAITREGQVVEAPPPGPDAGPGSPSGEAPAEGGAATPTTGADRPAPRSRVAPPRVGITGSFLPPVLRPTLPSARPSPSTTSGGDGFEEDLPYDPVDGPLEAEPPDDELAAFFDGDPAGRGMAIPVATALVLAVWAFHLRVLARAAQPPS